MPTRKAPTFGDRFVVDGQEYVLICDPFPDESSCLPREEITDCCAEALEIAAVDNPDDFFDCYMLLWRIIPGSAGASAWYDGSTEAFDACCDWAHPYATETTSNAFRFSDL